MTSRRAWRAARPGPWASASLLLAAALLATPGLAASLPQGAPSIFATAGPEAARVAGWAWALFIIAGVVFAVVLALLLFALLRRSRGGAYHQALPEAQERRWFRFVLVAGGIVPALTLATVMGLNVFSERKVAQEARRPTLTIQVIGHQFWWELRYPQAGFTGANELHIPVGQPVRLELASADVIHSFWVPQLSPKTDMIPGQTNILTLTASRPGLYRGQCAEFCGAQHAHMIFTVVAQEPADYAAWLARERKPANPAALTARP